MKYFLGVKNANELKELFRKLCNSLHPDKGGKASEFIAMMDVIISLQLDKLLQIEIKGL